MRAVLDANIYVSALVKPEGPPGQILDQFLRFAAFEVVLSPAIAEEVSATLGRAKLRRYFPPGEAPAAWFARVSEAALAVSGDRGIPRLCRDPDDDKYLAAAIEANAWYLVSGDEDLLILGTYEGVAIVRPRTFLTLLDSEAG